MGESLDGEWRVDEVWFNVVFDDELWVEVWFDDVKELAKVVWFSVDDVCMDDEEYDDELWFNDIIEDTREEVICVVSQINSFKK